MNTSREGLKDYGDLGDDPGRYVRSAAGYLGYRWTPAWGCEIVTIEVGEEYRRKGNGRLLVGELVALCRERGVRTVYAITRESNSSAKEFYAACGFRAIGLYHFYKDSAVPSKDAVMYVYDIRRTA